MLLLESLRDDVYFTSRLLDCDAGFEASNRAQVSLVARSVVIRFGDRSIKLSFRRNQETGTVESRRR